MADPLVLARLVLDDALAGRPTSAARLELASLDPEELAAALSDDPSRIAFWLNIYNAVVRARLSADPGAYRRRRHFFAAPAVVIAGRRLSPNAIEHGILRRSAFLAGLGYLRNPFPSTFERQMRVTHVDPRIHFAMNCGARSCPPLAAWTRGTLDQDLERATTAYLASESRRLQDPPEIRVPRLLMWFRGDFGGRVGIRRLLERHGVLRAGENTRVRFAPYDWRLDDAATRPPG